MKNVFFFKRTMILNDVHQYLVRVRENKVIKFKAVLEKSEYSRYKTFDRKPPALSPGGSCQRPDASRGHRRNLQLQFSASVAYNSPLARTALRKADFPQHYACKSFLFKIKLAFLLLLFHPNISHESIKTIQLLNQNFIKQI